MHTVAGATAQYCKRATIIERVLAKFGIGKAANKSTTENNCLIMDKTTHPDLLNALGVEKMEANEKGVMLSNAQAEMLNKSVGRGLKKRRLEPKT